MRHLALLRWIRGLLPAFVIILLVLISAILIVITTIGIPGPLIRTIERELAKQDIYVRIDKVRVEFFDGFGFVARKIEVFDQTPGPEEKPLVLITRVKTDVSMDSLLKGDIGLKDLKGIELKGIFVSLPFHEGGKASQVRLQMKDLNAEVVFPALGLADITLSANDLEGIEVVMQGRLRFSLPKGEDKRPRRSELSPEQVAQMQSNREKKTRQIVQVLEYIHALKFPEDKKPRIKLKFDFNADDLISGRAFLTVNSPFIGANGYRFNDVNLEASYQSGTISVENFSFRDRMGELKWEGSYLLSNRRLSGRLDSHILWNPVIKAFFNNAPLPLGLKLTQGIGVSAVMKMTLAKDTYIPDEYQVLGELGARNFRVSGLDVRRLSADFSIQNDKYYVDNMKLVLPDSELTGRFLYADDLIRGQISSNIPLETYLTLAREWGTIVDIPRDVTISGIPDIKAEARVKLSPDKMTPPVVDVSATVRCKDIAYKDVKFSRIMLDAVYRNGEGMVPSFVATTEDGRELALSGKYNNKILSVKAKSDLPLGDWYRLISEWKESVTLPEGLVIQWSPEVEVEARVKDILDKDKSPALLDARLSLLCDDISYKEVKFKTVSVTARFDEGNLFIPGVSVTKEDGRGVTVTGELVKDDLKVALKSTLLIGDFNQMFSDPNLQMHSERMVFGKNGKLECEAVFKTNIKDMGNFEVTGSAVTSDLTYNGVPVEQGSTSFRYVPLVLTLNDSKLSFLYPSYDMAGKERKTLRPSRGDMSLKKLINYEKDSTLELVGLDAHAYPELVMQMFAPHLVKDLQPYRIHEVPYITAGAVSDIVDPDLTHTDLKLRFSTKGRVDYDFLKKTLKMSEASGRITIRREKFYMDDFSAKIWEGQAKGRIGAFVAKREGYDGSLKFVNCNLKNVGETFGGKFENAYANANIDFSMMGSKTNDLKASGRIELTEGDLLTIPFFGPLTTVFDGVFGFVPGVGDLVGSRINQASCDYNIVNGDLVTQNFLATGSNMKITGVATVNLDKISLNMSIRVNFKGFLGILLKPISIPFGGLFEFRGEGPLENPSWYPTPFSGAYSEGKKKE